MITFTWRGLHFTGKIIGRQDTGKWIVVLPFILHPILINPWQVITINGGMYESSSRS